MDKIAPDLLAVLARRHRAHADAVLRNDRDAMALRDAPIEVLVSFQGAPDALVAEGFPIGGDVANVAQGGLSPEQIRRLASIDRVLRIELPTTPFVTLDKSVPDILAKDAWAEGVPPDTDDHGKGAGVVVGIVDSGFDVYHGAFRNPDGSSRILRLWDQTFNYGGGVPVDLNGIPITGDLQPKDETGAVLTPARAPTDLRVPADSTRPQLFTNGAAFDTGQINAALTAHPNGKDLPISLRDQPVGSGPTVVHHGTHVAGIAAGNGAQNDGCTSAFTYVGVAPKADLVLVKTAVGGGTPNRISNLVAAAEFIFRVAARQNAPAGKPCVINFSLGSHGDPHNGQSAESRAFDTMTTGPLGVGRSIVIAASNDRDDDLHAAFTVVHNTTQTVRVNLVADSPRLSLFGSFNLTATLTCLVRAPGAAPVQQTAALATNTVNNTNVPIGTTTDVAVVTAVASGPSDPDSHFRVIVSNPTPDTNLPKGTWEFDIAASNAAADANIHLWIASHTGKNAAILPFAGAVASAQDVNRKVKRPADWIASTISALASTRSAITVAAYDAEDTGGPLAYFSSQGPAPNHLALGLFGGPDAIAKPDIAAPGMNIDAPRGEARKCCLECNCCVDRYVAEQGTSMAAPHIAGVIALMYARNPALTPDEIKTILRNTHRNPPVLPPNWPPPADLWGAGKVDAKAAVHVLVPRVVAPEEKPAQAPVLEPEPRILPVAWPERLRAWNGILNPHPSWNLCAALVSQHFDEVKRLIDNNRRVAAVWQRHGGPALVRDIAFADRPPDPPIPATLDAGDSGTLVASLLRVLLRFGGDQLRADIVRHASLVQALPGASWIELDRLLGARP
jgi:subtilisin family serine protease